MSEETTELRLDSQGLAPLAAVARHGWAAVVAWLLVVYYATTYIVPRLVGPDLNIYVLQPLLWGSLGVLAFWLWRRDAPDATFPGDRWLIGVAALVALFQIALFVLAGILAGFGHSPYARAAHMMALNLWFVATRLIGLECARWYLVRTLGRRSLALGVGAAWLLLWAVQIPIAGLGQLAQAQSAFRLAGRTLLPTAAEGVLATYLVLVGGPLASLAYRGALAAFEWLSPILPNLEWTLTAFLGTVAPVLGLLVIRDLLEWRAAPPEQAQARSSSGTGWVLAAVFVVFLFWLNTGLFGVRPALISGISMQPNMYMGDIAITRPVVASEVQVGDIVRFRLTRSSILHRVTEIRKEGGRTIFITQGDNNTVADTPWDDRQLEGKLVITVPKIGWVGIGARVLADHLLSVVRGVF